MAGLYHAHARHLKSIYFVVGCDRFRENGVLMKYSACSAPQPTIVAINILIGQVGAYRASHCLVQDASDFGVQFVGIQMVRKLSVLNEPAS